MTDKKLLEHLYENIRLYDSKNGNDYLIAFGRGKNHPIRHCSLTFHPYNFWHLLGCKADNKKYPDVYNLCKNGKDISEMVSLVHSYSEAYAKCEVFNKVFDFTANARYMKIGYVARCPEEFYLTMALGNETGIIGYDYPKGDTSFLVPKSTQNKRISQVSDELNKILFILSKRQEQRFYSNIEYEIKKGTAEQYLSEISKEADVKIEFEK